MSKLHIPPCAIGKRRRTRGGLKNEVSTIHRKSLVETEDWRIDFTEFGRNRKRREGRNPRKEEPLLQVETGGEREIFADRVSKKSLDFFGLLCMLRFFLLFFFSLLSKRKKDEESRVSYCLPCVLFNLSVEGGRRKKEERSSHPSARPTAEEFRSMFGMRVGLGRIDEE